MRIAAGWRPRSSKVTLARMVFTLAGFAKQEENSCARPAADRCGTDVVIPRDQPCTALMLVCMLMLAVPAMAVPGDDDNDGILNLVDNCTQLANADQRDVDEDGFGNACDADFNNDGIVNALDLALFKDDYFASGDIPTDLDGDGNVNVADLAMVKSLFFAPPGPSAMGPVAPGIGPLIDTIAALPEGEWLQVNTNLYSDVWAPEALRPLAFGSNPTPAVIIRAWSTFGWDRNRAQLVLYGGGHASYSGNDTYIWEAASGQWQRAALPTEVELNVNGNWQSIDGPDNSPGSAHTYDNAAFLMRFDRYVNFGGALWNSGRAYVRTYEDGTFEITGPYFFDPSKADGSKVGGITGSHVQREGPYPEIVGGQMWENRDLYINAVATGPLPRSFVNGLTAYSLEQGKDVIYLAAALFGQSSPSVFRVTFNELADPTLDTIELVGEFNSAPGPRGAGAYDPVRQVFVRTCTPTIPFAYWDLSETAEPVMDVRMTPDDASGEFAMTSNYGMDFDPVRQQFLLWDGGPEVFALSPPAAIEPEGWTIEQLSIPSLPAPEGPVQNGVLGKWKYAANFDVFVGLRDSDEGSVWFYKPPGWRMPPRGAPAAQ